MMSVRLQAALYWRFSSVFPTPLSRKTGMIKVRNLSTTVLGFQSLGISSSELLARLERLGMHTPSDIQRKAIPTILTGSDAVLCAETGSGKTLSYLLPTLQMLLSSDEDVTVPFDGKPRLAVIVPTQELVQQLHDTLLQVAPSMERLVKIACGKTGPTKADVYDVLLATPIALKDNVKPTQLEHVRHCVLDEADVLLTGSSSAPLLTHVLPSLRNRRNGITTQFIFAAATLPGIGTKSVRAFVNRYFPHAEEISTEGLHKPPPTLHQAFIQAEDVDLSAAVELGDEYLAKREVVKRAKERGWIASDSFEASMKAAAAIDNKWRQRCLIDALASTSCSDVGSVDDRKLLTERLTITRKSADRGSFATTLTSEEVERCNTRSTLVFVSTVDHAIDVVDFLKTGAPGLKVAGLHKRLSPEDREKTFRKFQAGQIKVLVCTDVAARGLDTVNVEHVIQYHVATDASSYLHRIGRTARMGRYGRVTTFVGPDSERLIADIVTANVADVDMEGVFSRKRSLRRQHKKRVGRVENEAIERLNPSRQPE